MSGALGRDAYYILKAPLRRFGLPLAWGIAFFAIGRLTDSLATRFILFPAGGVVEGLFLATIVAVIVFILMQRFGVVSAQLDNFASDIAHQIRTPLAIQQSLAEHGLRRTLSAAQYQDTLESMLEETHNLTRLVDALLFMARMESGQTGLSRSRFQACDLVREVASLLDVLAKEKSQTLTVDVSEQMPVDADRAMLRQVVINLLANAIKFTPEGGKIFARTHLSPSGCVEIEVRDTGPGINPKDRVRVFERFYRSSTTGGGTGLGLAISKSIVEAHRGEISCENTASGGCRFTVLIPSYQEASAIRYL